MAIKDQSKDLFTCVRYKEFKAAAACSSHNRQLAHAHLVVLDNGNPWKLGEKGNTSQIDGDPKNVSLLQLRGVGHRLQPFVLLTSRVQGRDEDAGDAT